MQACGMWSGGGILVHKHFQVIVKGNFSSLPVLYKKIKGVLGMGCESTPACHVVSCERLRDEGLHIFLGMVGYSMKNNMEEHFEFVHCNVYAEDMNEGHMEYAKFGNVGLNNHANLSHSNILQHAHEWAHFHMKNIWVLVFLGLYSICARAGNFTPT